MHTEIMPSLAIRHAPLFDQPHSLKLELACKLPSLHHAPPVPSKHLTRCLQNRVQAKMTGSRDDAELAVATVSSSSSEVMIRGSERNRSNAPSCTRRPKSVSGSP